MTYNNSLVAAIKCNGKILRESNGVVYLPFGSEYSIYLKNLSTVKALVGVTIDGEDVLAGRKLIIGPNEKCDLERAMGYSMSHGYRFKFIEKTQTISDYRGDRIDDGIIRIEYAFEQHITYHHHREPVVWDQWWPDGKPYYYTTWGCGEQSPVLSCFAAISTPQELNRNDKGITVEGSDSDQSFVYGSIGQVGETSVIIFELKGKQDDQPVVKPLGVKDKLKCKHCGRVSRSDNKYCPGCGARLIG